MSHYLFDDLELEGAGPPRVFVPQRPVRKCRSTGRWVDRYDLSPAEAFGDLVYMTDRLGNVESPHLLRSTIEDSLLDFQKHDYVLLLGDPALAAAVTHCLGLRGYLKVRALKWDRQTASYQPVLL